MTRTRRSGRWSRGGGHRTEEPGIVDKRARERGAQEQVQRYRRPGMRTRTSKRAVSRVGGRASGDGPGDGALKPPSIFISKRYNNQIKIFVSAFLSLTPFFYYSPSSLFSPLAFSSFLHSPSLSCSLSPPFLSPPLPVRVYHQKYLKKKKKYKT